MGRNVSRWFVAHAVALACLLAPAVAQGFEARVPHGYFGVSAPGLSVLARDADPMLATHAEGIRAAGLDFVRSTVDWRQVEPLLGIGGVHLYDWAATDRLVRALASRGIEFVPNLMGTPNWARAADALFCGPSPAVAGLHAPAYGDLARAIVRRYGRGGAFWAANPELTAVPVRRVELWNEPNWTGSWCPAPQPERFARIAVEAARKIKSFDSSVETILGGLVLTKENQYFSGGGMRGMETGSFLTRMVAAEPELTTLLDQVAIHLYDPDPDLNVSLLGWVRARLEAAGLAETGLLVTEFGWHTQGSDEALSEEARAAAYTALIDQLPRTDCDLRGLAAHEWSTPEADPTNLEHWFGLADPDTGVLHPAGVAYRDAVALFEGRGPAPAPRETIPVCGGPPPDQDGDGTPDEDDDYPLDPDRDTGSGETPPSEPAPEEPIRPPSVDRGFFSVASDFMPARPEERALHYDAMRDLGVGSVRQSVEWDIVEPKDGVAASSRFAWTDTDRRVIAYAQRGISTSLAPLHAPAWLSGDPAVADARFADFVAAVARRYGSEGVVWDENRHLDRGLATRDYELWANANVNTSAWDGTASPGEYAATYATARAALRAADPAARAIVSVAAAGDGSAAAAFLRGMVAARPSLAGQIDGVYMMASSARSAAALETVVARVRLALEQAGNPQARLRVGFGAPVGGPGALSEEARAAFVAAAASRLPRLDCGVDEAVLYSWTSAQADTTNPWDWFGVTSLADATPTSTAHAFADAGREFTGFGELAPDREALHPCMGDPLDRDGDGTPDAADPAPLDPDERTPLAVPPTAPRFDLAPAAWSKERSPAIRYSAAGAVKFRCRLDSGAWQLCDDRFQPTSLADGPHSLEVRAVDGLGLVGPSARHAWNVDTRPPETAITAGPSGLVGNDDVTFTLASDEPGGRFMCRLDARPWDWCPATVAYTDLAEGGHTFDAIAVDRAGNADPGREHRYFEVRTVPARPSLSATGLETQTPVFTFDAAHAASFECRFDAEPFAACSGARQHTPARPLQHGSHRFEVRGVGPTGKRGPAAGWGFTTYDRTAPQTTISEAPPAETHSASVQFRLTSDEAGVSFRCKLDSSTWVACAETTPYAGLAEGTHRFQAAAVDRGGNIDATPAVHEFTVSFDREPPALALKAPPPGRDRTPTVHFTAVDDVGPVTTRCRVDKQRWRDCGSPFTTPKLRRGRHRVQVHASDAAGNSSVRAGRLRVTRRRR